MNIYDAVYTRRFVRDYLDKSVSISCIEKVLKIALRTPSEGNLNVFSLLN